ncbi:DNA packaging protein, partial [Salmonella enterica subsp. enterica]|nr:DNA packaging protein [Salmonella enterica subsp. enterica]
AIAEELFDIADDGTNDWMEKLDKDGEAIGYQLNGEHVQRSKLRIDTRKWYLSKIMPKKYGDRIQHEQKITITDLSDEELDRRLMELTNAQSQSGTED